MKTHVNYWINNKNKIKTIKISNKQIMIMKIKIRKVVNRN